MPARKKTDSSPSKPRAAGKRPSSRVAMREDGAQTRQQLLEVAGRVFAERGYVYATSKEICERAQANIAAVNYHFGGKDGLYAAVLEEAHARLVSIDIVTEITQSTASAADKLRLLLRKIVGEVAKRDDGAWELRVLSRELMAPTALMDKMMKNQVMPKARLVTGMIGDILGVAPTHPAVSRATVSIVGPCLFLLIANPDWQKKIFPALLTDTDELVEHMVTFALGGLQSVAAGLRNSSRSAR
ncbi:CerR family C-terminal domain-containing protein [Steroidobacter cummioxidans]|uniref:CerR family C-terminal domain-containing protein n=1 Tax=Steroidobacter cummioxidans TaxID=1803913 RepID=UPI000E3226C3|nr:CerR family C-terminal domain-containing protein [Steroidobacter cummioxidans]